MISIKPMLTAATMTMSLSMVLRSMMLSETVFASSSQRHIPVKNRDDLFREKILEKSIYLRSLSSSTDDASTQGDDDYSYSSSSSSSFDVSKFSLKFHSCSSLSSFDFDNFGVDTSGSKDTYPYSSTQVVTYRLCPTSTCQDDSWSGCKNVYGNYAITLDGYFQAKQDYEDDYNQVNQDYCSYCENCEALYKKYNEKCTNYSSCSNYKSKYCKARRNRRELAKQQNKNQKKDNNKQNEFNISKLVDCTRVAIKSQNSWDKYEDDDNTSYLTSWERSGRVYLKIYCDGYLKIGIFKDNKCTKYIGDEVSIKDATGLAIKEDSLKSEFESNKCKACKVVSFLKSKKIVSHKYIHISSISSIL